MIKRWLIMILEKNYKKNALQMIVAQYEQQVVWEAVLAEYKRLGHAN
jgi:hypothetical protein